MHTLAFEKELSCHLYTLEGQSHIIYSFGKHSRAIFGTGTFFLKDFLYYLMQSYPARALDRKLQVDWARDAREGPRVLISLRVDFRPMG